MVNSIAFQDPQAASGSHPRAAGKHDRYCPTSWWILTEETESEHEKKSMHMPLNSLCSLDSSSTSRATLLRACFMLGIKTRQLIQSSQQLWSLDGLQIQKVKHREIIKGVPKVMWLTVETWNWNSGHILESKLPCSWFLQQVLTLKTTNKQQQNKWISTTQFLSYMHDRKLKRNPRNSFINKNKSVNLVFSETLYTR